MQAQEESQNRGQSSTISQGQAAGEAELKSTTKNGEGG